MYALQRLRLEVSLSHLGPLAASASPPRLLLSPRGPPGGPPFLIPLHLPQKEQIITQRTSPNMRASIAAAAAAAGVVAAVAAGVAAAAAAAGVVAAAAAATAGVVAAAAVGGVAAGLHIRRVQAFATQSLRPILYLEGRGDTRGWTSM